VASADDGGHICFAEARRGFRESVEHGLQIEGRTAADPMNSGIGSLERALERGVFVSVFVQNQYRIALCIGTRARLERRRNKNGRTPIPPAQQISICNPLIHQAVALHFVRSHLVRKGTGARWPRSPFRVSSSTADMSAAVFTPPAVSHRSAQS
jgi:hypothetical protein